MALATYLPTPDHGLSAAAQQLSPARLDNEALAAERLLGLSGTAFTGADGAVARKAVAVQVNFQLLNASRDGIRSEGRGRQSVSYETGAVSPEALRLVAMVLGPPHQSTSSAAEIVW